MAIETLYRVADEDELYTSMEAAKDAEFAHKLKKVLLQCPTVYLAGYQTDKLADEVVTYIKDNYTLTEIDREPEHG